MKGALFLFQRFEKLIALFLVFSLFTIRLEAYDLEIDGILYTISTETSCIVSGYTNQIDAEVSIPSSIDHYVSISSSINQYKVEGIGNEAFRNCVSLKSVIIPNSVTGIGEAAFEGCANLTNVEISSNVTNIGHYVFNSCSMLTQVTMKGTTPCSIGQSVFPISNAGFNIIVPKGSLTAYKSAAGWISYASYLAEEKTISGVDDNIAWVLNLETGVLTLSGSGEMPDYLGTMVGNNSETTAPWGTYYNKYIKEIQVKNGITNIGENAFAGCSSLTSVMIPSSVTSIERNAFYNCTSLPNVTIPEGVKSIGESAFYRCNSLSSVTIPKSVTSIGFGAFQNCSKLTSVTIPEGVISIGSYAFSYCSSLTSVTIPSSVTGIGNHAFSSCSILSSVTISEGVTSIGNYAFSSCGILTSITIPSSVTRIGDLAFDFCSSMKKISVAEGNPVYDSRNNCNAIIETETNVLVVGCMNTVIPESVTSIGSGTFRGCNSLTSVTIPSSVTSIGENAFDGCSSLKSVTIPEGVTSIGDWGFRDCSSLTRVTIPSSVTSIGENAFDGCNSLKNVKMENSTPCTIGKISVFPSSNNGFKIYIPKGSSDAYTTAEGWSDYADYIEELLSGVDGNVTWSLNLETGVLTLSGSGSMNDYAKILYLDGKYATSAPWGVYYSSIKYVDIQSGVTSIGKQAFQGCLNLTGIEISESVTNIGSYAFHGCSRLSSVAIPSSVTSIEYGAFYDCSSLASVTIPEGVTSIGYATFFGCSSLASVIIPSSVTGIEAGAFQNCSSLTSVTIPSSVTSIGDTAFGGCSSLKNVTIPKAVTSIGNNAFQGCSSLTVMTIPEGVTNIGNHAFADCSRLSNVTIPSSVMSIGNYAFSSCSSLTNVTMPSSVTSIGEYAFYECSRLSSITIPEDVTSIGYYAFSGCLSLSSITLPQSLIRIGHHAFRQCEQLTEVFIPQNVSTIEEAVFSFCKNIVSINVDENNEHLTSMNGCNVVLDKNGKLLVGCKTSVIPESTTCIGTAAFEGMDGLKEITLPQNVRTIEDYAFASCPNLRKIKCLYTGELSVYGYSFHEISPFGLLLNPSSVDISPLQSFLGSGWEELNMWDYRGDINLDSSVDISDVTILVSNILNTQPSGLNTEVDVNGDGNIDISDVTSLISVILGTTQLQATKIVILNGKGQLFPGEQRELTAIVLPSNANSCDLDWVSADEGVATVNGGIVTAVAAGKTTVSAIANDGTGLVGSVEIVVESKNPTFGNNGVLKQMDEDDYYVFYTSPSGKRYSLATLGSNSIVLEELNNKYYTFHQGNIRGGSDAKAYANASSMMEMNGYLLSNTETNSYSQTGYANIKTEPINGSNGLSSCRTWESQVFYYDATRNKYAVRLTNSDTDSWGGSRFIYVDDQNNSVVAAPKSMGDDLFIWEIVKKSDLTSSLTLSSTSLSLSVGATYQLSATTIPAASSSNVSWQSSNESVATVSSSGLVRAISTGEANIICTVLDGSDISANCSVKVLKAPDTNGKPYVDLGLPSGKLWATYNVGASSPEGYGDYYAWGETTAYGKGKSEFSWYTYKYCNGSNTSFTKYVTSSSYGTVDGRIELVKTDDAANVSWGGDWCIPTDEEWTELRLNCTWTFSTVNGVKGYTVKGKNGKSIFLPAAGYRYDTKDLDIGSFGNYWSSTLNETNNANAYQILFSPYGDYSRGEIARRIGMSIRPICSLGAKLQ